MNRSYARKMHGTPRTNSKVQNMFSVENIRWWALIVLELGNVMIIIDITVVNIALAPIKTDLGFSETGLVWVVNAYMIPFAGLLLLSGKLGDVFGHRRLFLLGIAFFTLASLACGLSPSRGELLIGRALQGIGGALVSSSAFSLTLKLFTETSDRATAIGVSGIISAAGGSVGLVLGGVLTGLFNWHWIFLINLPIGAVIYGLGIVFLPPHNEAEVSKGPIDVTGAVFVTSALMLATYTVLNWNQSAVFLSSMWGYLVLAALLLLGFVLIESRVPSPLVPLRLFRTRNLTLGSIALMLLCTAIGTWYFVTALYLRIVLHSTALTAAMVFLPANVIAAGFSLVSSKIVTRIGIKTSLFMGLAVEVSGLLLLAHTPVNGDLLTDVLPAVLLLGLGGNLAFIPLLLASVADTDDSDSGVASGIINTTFTMGQTFGLALIVCFAKLRTDNLLAAGTGITGALLGGYHQAYLLGALLAGVAAAFGAALKFTIQRATTTTRA
jgi:EmrB/QacA subfamily drug resistance transporter